ncbi:cytochrome C oxidase subunit IV family protein [Chloracidobacterium thermophilum]|uniref:cytochrome C oxidase subunit IV family protein n=2 Tax=Chloracidobacterium thermophilum TaxID=458033 RepID=UPI00201711D3|nr:cytochrome C oxidase subunit IV family protein [Chloracidobacterium thermophilum]
MSNAHSPVAHHFYTIEQQKESATIGMWLFLATEILLFGALFTAYAVYRYKFSEAFMVASSRMDWKMGGLNTLFLIVSSVTMVFAVSSAEKGRRGGLLGFLAATGFFGTLFLVVKYFEYKHHYLDHDIPGLNFQWTGAPELANGAQIFFFLYFFMTGLHALHMVVGLGLLIWIFITAYQGKYSPSTTTRLRCSGCTGTSWTWSGFSFSPCSTCLGHTCRRAVADITESEATAMGQATQQPATHHANGHSHAHPTISPATYLLVLAALVIGTVVTVWTASMDLGAFNTPVALAIAIGKATLIILYFMHIRYSTWLTRTVVIGSFFFLIVLFGLTFADYLTREKTHEIPSLYSPDPILKQQ